MTQLLQNIYAFAPYLFMLVLISATFLAFWLIGQLKKSPGDSRFSQEDNLFLKRNAARLRKMQLN
jgi:hypothetical protein